MKHPAQYVVFLVCVRPCRKVSIMKTLISCIFHNDSPLPEIVFLFIETFQQKYIFKCMPSFTNHTLIWIQDV